MHDSFGGPDRRHMPASPATGGWHVRAFSPYGSPTSVKAAATRSRVARVLPLLEPDLRSDTE